MGRAGIYCKAYLVRDLCAFAQWRPNPAELRPAAVEVDGREVKVPRGALRDDDVLFLQEDFTVTDGIFLDEHVVFADDGPDWRAFCAGALGFAPPAEPEIDRG